MSPRLLLRRYLEEAVGVSNGYTPCLEGIHIHLIDDGGDAGQ